jgi:hypothetical protein
MTSELERDKDGTILTRPVTDWATHSLYGSAIVLAIEYVHSQQELEKGDRHQIQLVLTRQGCLDVAEALTKAANRVQDPHSDIQVH